MSTAYRNARFENFAGGKHDLAELYLFLINAMTHVVLDDPAWQLIRSKAREVEAELKTKL